MKLDKNLVREVLLQVEAGPNPMDLIDLSIPDHSQEEIACHVQILNEAGLMVVGQVLPFNPAHAVRGPKHTRRRGKTPVLQADEARTLIGRASTEERPLRSSENDSPAGGCGRDKNRDRLPNLPGDWDHRVPQERRPVGDRAANGRAPIGPHDWSVRPA